MSTLTRRYDFICTNMTCYYYPNGKKHECTDCAAAKTAKENDDLLWVEAVARLAWYLEYDTKE